MTEHNRDPLPNTQVPEPLISPEVTDDEHDDNASDSGLDSDSVYSDSTSLSSSVTRYREENGRRYHAYGTMEHWGPNDEQAQEQQDLSHHLWTLSLNGKLYLPPVDHLQNVLDMGTGTGIWAMDMADAHPEATVKGIDLSPIQPSWIPPNLKFEVDDYNLEWLDHNKYDLIHARELLGTVPSWPEMYRKVLGALKPGGWFQQADPQVFLTSSYDTLGPDHVYHQWNPLLIGAGKKAGLDFDSAPHMKRWLEEAGFINVTEYRVPWPIGTWPKDPHQREIGAFNQVRIGQGVLDFCGRRLTNNLGWSRAQLEVFAASMRAAVKNNKLLAHHYVWFAYGQKPPAH
ncbi:hypothetical protein SI65_00039 [Aspergillus cristatus]|uniref:S-adenosyl-L-methionine-dependent methyltransferase n=1 Tax=Aspergillus cristatus TaxID=573508 RepID=A0A1E3BNU1_ASPCR|nr:hypothetical protein SI65_00039 [Aspergillus cristatus]